jgi:hypothetical protein
MRVRLVQVVVQLPPLGWVNVQFPQIRSGNPAHIAGFIIDGRLTLD